jgi:hypothetical protein
VKDKKREFKDTGTMKMQSKRRINKYQKEELNTGRVYKEISSNTAVFTDHKIG